MSLLNLSPKEVQILCEKSRIKDGKNHSPELKRQPRCCDIWGHPVPYTMAGSIPALCPLDAIVPAPKSKNPDVAIGHGGGDGGQNQPHLRTKESK